MIVTESFGVGKPRVAKYLVKSDLKLVNPDLVIGFELETEQCNALSATGYEKLCKPMNMTITQDGSLRGSAYEFLTLPMRTDSAISSLTDFFAATKFNDANYSDRCSIHVHVNCTDVTSEQLSNLALLYTVFEEILFEYVGLS